ncbi:ABC transporter permease [Piscinibacter sakaiensis]
MGVQFILMQGVEFGVALLLMRRSALWLRLRAAPLTRGHLLGSRLLSGALISAGVFAVLFVVAIAGFGVRILGSLAGLVAIVAAFSLMTAAFGLMIAAIGRSPEATRGLAILATLLLVMVGGAWVPSFLFPPWLQTAAAWTPTHWAVNGLDAMTWRGQPWTEAVLPTLVQLGFAALFAAVALWRFRWDE